MFVCRECATRLLGRNSPMGLSTRYLRKKDLSTVASIGERAKIPTTNVVHNRLHRPQATGLGSRPSRFVKHPETNTRYSTSSGSPRPFRLAIIGSGPAGFYTAARILKHHHETKIDMYERLPVPFGLVRYGVAPDHPEVKNCQDRFEEIAEAPAFEFIGNVDVGRQIPLETLRRHYDAVLFTYGASEDRLLGVEGEQLKHVWSARNFVAWYNGLPGYSHLDFGLKNATDVAIIGQGNVSLDVARILLTPAHDLRKTDVPEPVLQTLSESNVKHVTAIGRRGPLQAAFTIKEIRELTVIPDVRFEAVDRSFFPEDLKTLPRARKRIAELLLKVSASPSSTSSGARSFGLKFMSSPTRFQPMYDNPDVLGSVVLQKQTFADIDSAFDPAAAVQATSDEMVTFPASLAFRSIGYKSTELPGLSKIGIHFDKRRGIIPNEGGRVVQIPASQPGMDVAQVVPGLYVAGWVKRGPTGVIASTMEDAFATADCITQDLDAGRPFLHGKLVDEERRDGWAGVQSELRSTGGSMRRTRWGDWQKIDRAERERGARLGKEREKFTSVEEMLKVLDG